MTDVILVSMLPTHSLHSVLAVADSSESVTTWVAVEAFGRNPKNHNSRCKIPLCHIMSPIKPLQPDESDFIPRQQPATWKSMGLTLLTTVISRISMVATMPGAFIPVFLTQAWTSKLRTLPVQRCFLAFTWLPRLASPALGGSQPRHPSALLRRFGFRRNTPTIFTILLTPLITCFEYPWTSKWGLGSRSRVHLDAWNLA